MGRRGAGKDNKYYLKRYAAKFISEALESENCSGMEEARNRFLAHVLDIVDAKASPPEGWDKEIFQEFIGKKLDRMDGRRLKPQYGQKLTQSQLAKWL